MKCPFCDEDVSSAAALCSSCREILPSQNLFDFYRTEIAKDRSLVLKENRATLDLRAQEQFETRTRLLKEARERQFQAEEAKRRVDRENSLIEERKREKAILKNRQTRKRRLIWISKFVVAPLVVLIIALSFWINARQSAALTAKQHQESLELCPLGPTLSFLYQKLLTMSPSEVGKEPFASDLENAISRLDSLSTGRQANTGIDAVRYLSIDLTYLRNPMSDNLMIERISKARNQLRVVTSISNPKTCGNTGIPFVESSKIQEQVSTGVTQATKSLPTTKSRISAKVIHRKPANPVSPKVQEWFFPEIVSWESSYLGMEIRSNNSWQKYMVCVTFNNYHTIQHAGLIELSGTWGDRGASPFARPPQNVEGNIGNPTDNGDDTATYCGLFNVNNGAPGPYPVRISIEGSYPGWGFMPDIGVVSFAPSRSSHS